MGGSIPIESYKKYVYWLEGAGFRRLKSALEARGLPLGESQGAVCAPLSARLDLGVVRPETWKTFSRCKRQLSWYGSSPFSGKILVVSAKALSDVAGLPEVIIQESSFRPKHLPNREDKRKLIALDRYLRRRPEEWEAIDAEERERRIRWLKKMGLSGISHQEWFEEQSANHANFIEPLYCLEEGNQPVPYSIGKTWQICSACLEFYNILGSEFLKKLVVPCPGAVLFAGMKPNRYYQVVQPGGGER